MTRCLTSPLKTSVVLALTLGGAFGRVSLAQTSTDPKTAPHTAQSSQIPKVKTTPPPPSGPIQPPRGGPGPEEVPSIPPGMLGMTSGTLGPEETALPANRRNAGAAGAYIDSAIPLSLVR